MITNICTYMMCCFIVTSRIKVIQSAGNNQICPIRFFIQISDDHYLRAVNNLKTFNKNPVVIKPAEQRILAEPRVGNIKEYQLKLKIRDKLERKAKDIKCSFCVFAKSNILTLKNVVYKLKSGEPYTKNENTVKRFKQEAEIIVRLLLLGNFETGKWLWTYLLKTIAIRHYDDNKLFIHENPFEDNQLHTGVLGFIENCIAEKYLPPTAMESDLVLKNTSILVHSKMFSDLRASGWFLHILMGSDLVTVEFLYLKPFWDDENQLLFTPITQVNVDWSVPKQRHETEVVITREFVENRIWMYEPYGRLDHQHLLINIVDARIYCNLFVILYVYEKQLSILDQHTLTHISKLICNVTYAALNLTGFKDDFLVVILSELKFAGISNTDEIKDILGRVRTKANEILDDLNGATTSGIDRLSFNVDERQLSTNDLIIRIIRHFDDYLKEFISFLPFEYHVFLHFMDVVKLSAAQYI